MDHWIYGNCDPDKGNFTKFEWERYFFSDSACIKKFYNHYDEQYYNIYDEKLYIIW